MSRRDSSMKRLAVTKILVVSLLLGISTSLSAQDLHSCADRFNNRTDERIRYNLSNTYIISHFKEFDEEFLNNFPFEIPTTGYISSEFGYRRNPFKKSSTEFHKGIDIQNIKGTYIRAPANGTIVKSEYQSGYGNMILLKHSETVSSFYAHLSTSFVLEGQKIKKGQIIGAIGSTGLSTGPHLHYEILIDGENYDPAIFWNFLM